MRRQVQWVAASIMLVAATSALAQVPRPARFLSFPQFRQALQLGLHLDTEAVSNVSGGLRRATDYDTLLHVGFNLDSAPLGLWQGGKLRLSAIRVVSGQPDIRSIGDLQVTSNIAAPSASRIYQFWYRQRLGSGMGLRAGLIDMNQYFAVTPHAGAFLNASFGIVPTVASNVAASIYPEPGAGVIFTAQGDGWRGELGMFQAQPSHRGEPFRHGAMVIAQVQRGGLQAGLWNYRDTSGTPGTDWGGYASIGGMLARGINGFLQLGAAPRSTNAVPYYLGAGVLAQSPIAGRSADRLGVAMARAWIRGTAAPAETSWELTYVLRVSPHFVLQPDVQYIVHPAGSIDIPNATVIFLRAHVEFDS